jgi:hypothetical protein
MNTEKLGEDHDFSYVSLIINKTFCFISLLFQGRYVIFITCVLSIMATSKLSRGERVKGKLGPLGKPF